MLAWLRAHLARRADAGSQAHAHRTQRPLERVQHEAHRFERDRPEEGVVLWLTEDDGTWRDDPLVREQTVRDVATNGRAVGKDEIHGTVRPEPEPAPYFVRQDRVGGPAVDQEAHGCGRSAFATHVDVDMHHSHAVLLRSAALEGNS